MLWKVLFRYFYRKKRNNISKERINKMRWEEDSKTAKKNLNDDDRSNKDSFEEKPKV